VTIHVRNAPTAVQTKHAIPFKIFVPRGLEEPPARAAWNALRHVGSLVLADPFIAPDISTVFPGVLYVDDHDHAKLSVVAAALDPAVSKFPAEFEDSWIEVWVPDGYEDQADALDITDLTQG
jgi:hypothetical protein